MAGASLKLQLVPDQQIGPYLIIEQIGVGGMGMVFKALDKRSGQLVALKFITSSDSLLPSEEQVGRFEQEGRLLQNVNHNNVAKVYEQGVVEGRHFIAMEYIEGCDFETINQRLAVPFNFALPLFLQILSGVSALHRSQIIHRDIKPPNILLRADRTIKIVDLGIAKKTDESGIFKTEVGLVVGTPRYLAPEIAKGSKANYRSDIWSLGAVFYEFLVGQPLIPGQTAAEIFYNHHHTEFWIPDECQSFVTKKFLPVLQKMCARSPDARFASCEQILSILRPWGGSHPEVRRDAFKTLIKPLEGEERIEHYLTNRGVSQLKAKQIKFISIQKTLARNPMAGEQSQLQMVDILAALNEVSAAETSKAWLRRSSTVLAMGVAAMLGFAGVGIKHIKSIGNVGQTEQGSSIMHRYFAMNGSSAMNGNSAERGRQVGHADFPSNTSPMQDFVPDKIKQVKFLAENLSQLTLIDRNGKTAVVKMKKNPLNGEMRLLSFALEGGVPVEFGPEGIKIDLDPLARKPASLNYEPEIAKPEFGVNSR